MAYTRILHCGLALVLLVASNALTPALTAAEPAPWVSHGPVGSGYTLVVDPINTSHLLAGSGRRIFESTDGAASWLEISDYFVASLGLRLLVMDPANPATLYAGSSQGGVYKSTDGGHNWNPVNTGLTDTDILALAVDPANPGTLYAGSSRVFKSIDSGAHWAAVENGLPGISVSSLAIHPISPTILYAGTLGGGVYRTSDGGAHWAPVNTGLNSSIVLSLAIHPITPTVLYAGTHGGGVYKSVNGGGNWTGIFGAEYAYTVVIDPQNPELLYAGFRTSGSWNGNQGGVVKSLNAGQDWTVVNTGLSHPAVKVLAIDPANPATLYAGMDGGGIAKTTNSGDNWTDHHTGLSTGAIVQALAIHSAASPTLYAGTPNAIFKSGDGGNTWSGMNAGLPFSLAMPSIRAVAVDPVSPTIAYAAVWGFGTFLYKTTNGGTNWELTPLYTPPFGGGTATPLSVAIDPQTPETIYAGTSQQGVYKSPDRGETWEPSNTGIQTQSVYGVVVDPTTPATIYAMTTTGVFKSVNSGGNWTPINTGLTGSFPGSLAIDPSTPNTLYATTTAGVFRSIDAGAHWHFNCSVTGSIVVHPVIPGRIFIGNGQGVFVSDDGGLNWMVMNDGLSQSFFSRLVISGAAPYALYAGTSAGVFSTDSTLPVSLPAAAFEPAMQTVVESVGTVTLTVNLNASNGVTITVPFSVSGTAAAGTDHNLANGTFSVPPLAQAANVTFDVADDADDDEAETIVVTLGPPQNAVLGRDFVHTLTIQDNDEPFRRLYLPLMRK